MQFWKNKAREKWLAHHWTGWNDQTLMMADKLLIANSQPEDVCLKAALDALSSPKIEYSRWLHLWWQKHPEHFSIFWESIKQSPSQKLTSFALEVLAYHIKEAELQPFVNICMLNENGRLRLLQNIYYHHYLHDLSIENAFLWVKPTVYSMEHAKIAFECLSKLIKIDNHNIHVLNIALDKVMQDQDQHKDQRVKKAWSLSNEDLNQWMDEDKTLPYWFDPINRQTWLEYLTNFKLSIKI